MSRIWMAVDPLGIGATQHGENLCDCVERIRHCAYVKFCGFCPPKVPEPQDNLFPFFRWNVEYQKISYELHIVGNVLERSILSYKEVYIIEENQCINQFFLCPFSGPRRNLRVRYFVSDLVFATFRVTCSATFFLSSSSLVYPPPLSFPFLPVALHHGTSYTTKTSPAVN